MFLLSYTYDTRSTQQSTYRQHKSSKGKTKEEREKRVKLRKRASPKKAVSSLWIITVTNQKRVRKYTAVRLNILLLYQHPFLCAPAKHPEQLSITCRQFVRACHVVHRVPHERRCVSVKIEVGTTTDSACSKYPQTWHGLMIVLYIFFSYRGRVEQRSSFA